MFRLLTWLIPTCVGSTSQRYHGNQRRPAHPPVCGEHTQWLRAKVVKDGSSPRVWGALMMSPARAARSRLIPTCVGSTAHFTDNAVARSAHPHVCGEHRIVHLAAPPHCGSSPRVWGARTYRLRITENHRLIPTCVGSTTDQVTVSISMTAHPHVCGEHVVFGRGG